MEKNPVVTIEMEDGNAIKIELYPEIAANTVNNFISLASKGFYEGVIFHRVIKGFMIQGGDPQGTGMGGADYNIPGEFSSNGFENNLKHARGVISMARAANPNSASSQFFIMHKDSPHLDGQYAGFGKVIEGIEEVDAIAETEADYHDRPVKDQKIAKVSVELFGYQPQEPKKA
jgi:peptidyl-prolyl cis-trans isomerase B (cyclophilin B)